LQDVDEYKRELKSRQRKIDNNLDNWGQKLPNNDPFGVGRQMALDQKKLNKTLNDKEMELELYENKIKNMTEQRKRDRSPETARADRFMPQTKNDNNTSRRYSPTSNIDHRTARTTRISGRATTMLQDEDGVDIIEMSKESPRFTYGNNRGGGGGGGGGGGSGSGATALTFEASTMGKGMSTSPSRDPVTFTMLEEQQKQNVDTSGGHIVNGHHRRSNNRQDDRRRNAENHLRNKQKNQKVYGIELKLQKRIRETMMTETALRHLFVQYDKTGTGTVNHNQFHLGFQKLGIMNATDDEVDSIIKRLDRGDGKINYYEFTRVAIRGVRHAMTKKSRRRRKKEEGDASGGVEQSYKYSTINLHKQNATRRKKEKEEHSRRRFQNKKRRSPNGEGGGGIGSRRRNQHSKSKVKSEDIQELLDICQELMREQQLLKKSVKRTNQKLGFSGDSTPEVVRGYM
jgi:hypothetical protein